MSTEAHGVNTIVVTGAASGIGRHVSQLLQQSGARVIALDRHQPGHEVAEYHAVDLADPASIAACVAQLRAGRLHGLCNIAGVPGTVPDSVVARVNFLGLRQLTLALLPRIERGGAIVNIASVAGCNWRERTAEHVELARTASWEEGQRWIDQHPTMNDQAYRKFKEALLVWSQLAAPELMRAHGVRMNCVSPGPVDTPILNDFKASLGQQNVDHSIALTGRPGTPQDIAPAVLFLLSPASGWVVGSELIVDGGLTAARLIERFPST